MLKYLLDTDVVSKSTAKNGDNVRRWLDQVDDSALAIDTLVIFELSRGIQKKRDADEEALAAALQAGLDNVKAAYQGRVLTIDAGVAELWGRLAGAEHKQWMDRGHIACARHAGLILVTCNSKDMKGRGVEVINPDRNTIGHWAADGSESKAT